MISGNQIRSEFLGFFEGRGHRVVDSSPLVPRNDPTLMFTNSGMVQFKDVFTGKESRDYSRATTSQKCVRAGGKHNDLDNVGYTARHHTFFEMLGNFSFGDYFKADAIEQAWALSTKTLGLPAEKILVTVHATDEEAAGLWRRIAGLPDDRIIRINSDDNWWRMGDSGPNGPCTELFYDHGPEVWGGPPGSPEEDGDRFVEFWNLVFMQYETLPDGTTHPLPKPSVDTGMGLERMTTILQGVHNNYDTDLFQPIIHACADLTGQAADGAMVTSHRVVADHLRCASFLIAEGVLPSNEGRGYVLRRIMRRGMRHAHLLGAKEPLMHRLAPALIDLMGGHYGELRAAEALIRETLRAEEERFRATLDRGLKLLDAELEALPEGGALPGETAFKLYDTYGFPLDLTADILRGRGRSVDQAGYDAAMAAQKAAARAAWAGTGDAASEKLWYDLRDREGPTEFLGYASLTAGARVLALVREGAEVAHVASGESFEMIVNQTPFYAEQGGQVGDRGRAATAGGAEIEVLDCVKRADGLYVHACRLPHEGHVVNQGDSVTLEVDAARRSAICAHHSATHLLHEALRRRLGEHVAQKGSLVAPDRLRFDISHGQPMTAAEIAEVEAEVNRRVRGCTPVTTRVMGLEAARASGARALFGEKYGDEVRVVAMGGSEPGANAPWSIELCGGTHVANTGEIGFFRILREEGLAAGVRRVEAVAGVAAEAQVARESAALSAVAGVLHVTADEAAARAEALTAEKRALEREVADLRRKLATGGGGGAEAETVAGVALTLRAVEGLGAKELKAAVDELLARTPGVAALAATEEGKGSIVVGVSKELTDRLDAVQLVRAAAPALGAKGGGGRPEMAQTGGPNGAGAADALAAVREAVRAALG